MFTTILYDFGMICMKLTRTDAVFSRTTVVLFLCKNESSPNIAKLFVDFLWTRRLSMGQRSTWGCPEGGTTHQGACRGPGAPMWVVPTSMASRTPSLPYKFTNIPKPFGVNLDQKFRRCRPL